MSRSHKYHTFGTVCGGSNKKDKKIANKKFRRTNTLAVKYNLNKLLYKLRECSNTYNFNTDGLAYYMNPKDWRKFRIWREALSDEELKEVYRKLMSK